jgi:Tfp pilus assembly protein PilF
MRPLRVTAAVLALAGSLAFPGVQSAEPEIPSRPLPPLPPGVGTPSPALREAIRLRELERQEQLRNSPHPDRLAFMTPRNYVRPRSAWLAAEKSLYQALLEKGRFDVLVVPFQVQDYAVDLSTRSLMTAELALAVGATGKKVPDPYLVSRALGDGERRFAEEDVSRLVTRLGVTRIVWGYVGHFRNNKLRITIQHQDRTVGTDVMSVGPVRTRHFEDLAFSDEDPPIEVYRRLLPEILKTLGVDALVPVSPGKRQLDAAAALPPSPLGIVSEQAEPARDAYALQLLAALAPGSAEGVRRRLLEKSILATLAISPASPDFRVLKARAYMGLGFRPAALKALGTPDSDEAKHLHALLNGDLPGVERYSARIRPGVRRFMAELELNWIASAYETRSPEQSLQEASSLNLKGEVWPLLARHAFTDWDWWSQHENLRLKALLDREFPVPGFTAESIVQGRASLGDLGGVRSAVDLSVFDHARRFSRAQAGSWCCQPVIARLTALDYLDFLESLGTDTLIRRARLMAWTQGLPQQTLDFLASIDSVYRDQPQLTVVRAHAELLLARSANGAQQDGLFKAAYEHASSAFYWEQGQTGNAAAAWGVMSEASRGSSHENLYASDFPFRPFYPTWESGGTLERQAALVAANLQAAIANSTTNFNPVDNWVRGYDRQGKWEEADRFLGSLGQRFAGNPQRALWLAYRATRKGDLEAAKRHYREDIKSRPKRWEPYSELGRLLFGQGQIEEAAKVFMSYPGFANPSDEDVVGLSNNAFAAGSLFYWAGEFGKAMPLYRIAADLRTGSDASLSSEIRIALAEGDYGAALAGSLQRARRYNSQFAYRDYLGMMHAMGRSKEAWQAFGTLITQMSSPELWETPLVGHRIEDANESDIAKWAASDAVRRSGYGGVYLLRAGVTDRTPTAELASEIAAVERRVWKLEDQGSTVVRESSGRGTPSTLNSANSGLLPLGMFDTTKKTRVKSDLVYFAEAYRAVRTRDFPRANGLFEEALALYDTRQHDLGYLLPYYAFAAAKSGHSDAVSARLKKLDTTRQGFDYHLARAVVSGLSGKTTDSLKNLTLARYRRPYTQARPVYTEYQFAEICEWLYEETRNAKYREVALDWAKSVQAFNPWFAWAYAMEAELSADKQARGRAIAMAYYLDKQSERLAKIPKDEVDAAVKAFADSNPFLGPRPSSKDAST